MDNHKNSELTRVQNQKSYCCNFLNCSLLILYIELSFISFKSTVLQLSSHSIKTTIIYFQHSSLNRKTSNDKEMKFKVRCSNHFKIYKYEEAEIKETLNLEQLYMCFIIHIVIIFIVLNSNLHSQCIKDIFFWKLV